MTPLVEMLDDRSRLRLATSMVIAKIYELEPKRYGHFVLTMNTREGDGLLGSTSFSKPNNAIALLLSCCYLPHSATALDICHELGLRMVDDLGWHGLLCIELDGACALVATDGRPQHILRAKDYWQEVERRGPPSPLPVA